MNQYTELVARLRELRHKEIELSMCCDCPPESTQNYEHAKTIQDAIDVIDAIEALQKQIQTPSGLPSDSAKNTAIRATDTGWIPWHGGERPLPATTRCFIKCRDGDTPPSRPADGWDWKHVGDYGDIVEYRVESSSATDTESKQ